MNLRENVSIAGFSKKMLVIIVVVIAVNVSYTVVSAVSDQQEEQERVEACEDLMLRGVGLLRACNSRKDNLSTAMREAEMGLPCYPNCKNVIFKVTAEESGR